jgi:transcriptional regulator with XRE-family HTH domain
VSFGADTDLPADQGRLIARRVREELARRRMSRKGLADKARVSISTLEKALSGSRPFTLATTIRLEQALGVTLRPSSVPEPAAAVATINGDAPIELGGYTRKSVNWIIGDYLTLRPVLHGPEAVFAYRIAIRWDDAASSLTFAEADRLDAAYAQKGAVAMSHRSGHIYLVTNDEGQFRLAVLGHPVITGEMYGVLTTLKSGHGAQLTPAAMPIVLVPIRAGQERAFGRIEPEDALYAVYRGYLARAFDDEFVEFFGR